MDPNNKGTIPDQNSSSSHLLKKIFTTHCGRNIAKGHYACIQASRSSLAAASSILDRLQQTLQFLCLDAVEFL
jgi:hypothetical protein